MLSRIIIPAYFLFFISFHSAGAQSNDTNVFNTVWKDIKISVNDGICTYTSPFKFSSSDWIKTGAVLLTTAAFMNFDKDIREEFSKNHNYTKDKIADIGSTYGNFITPIAVGGGIYFYGLIFSNDNVRETGRMLAEAVVFSGIITNVSKAIIGRSRPYAERGPYFYKMFQINEENLSLPSSHSTVAFAMSTVLSNRIKNIYATIGLYTLSTVTAISRIYTDNHWASDVVLGSAIGYFVGDYISSDKKSCNQKNRVSYNIYPSVGGLKLSVCF